MTSFFRFIILAIITTPPNFLFQKYLEDTYPTKEPRRREEKLKDSDDSREKEKEKEAPVSLTNTAIKFVLDQSIGCWTNTLFFIVAMGIFKGQGLGQILSIIENDFWSMVVAGYKLWPMVCLLNLLVVPFEYRMIVGNLAGFGWGVYVSLSS
jgi:protein Mpv17